MLELKRQLIHIFLGIIFVLLYFYELIDWWHFLILIILMYVILFIFKKSKFKLITFSLEMFDRKQSYIPAWGAFSFIKGFFLASLFFNGNIALAAMIILTFGDGFSTLIGYYFGKHPLQWDKKKTWEGTISGFITAFLGAIIFVTPFIAFIGVFIGMLVESLKKRHPLLDDNLLIPLFSGISMLLVSFL